MRPLVEEAPWTSVYGAARTSIAFGTFITLVGNDADVLFRPMGRTLTEAAHEAVMHINFFALWGDELESARLVAAAILLAVMAGYRPVFTGVLHYWISASFAAACVPAQGGDHVAVVLSLLLLPVTLTDFRQWHWQKPPSLDKVRQHVLAHVAWSSIFVARLQVGVIYLWAGTSKLVVPEWRDGTAVYYWFLDPKIGLPVEYHQLVLPILANPWAVSLLTWLPVVLELALFAAVVMRREARPFLLPIAVLFHLGNVVVFGLVSFFFSMLGALIVLLVPINRHIDFTRAFRTLGVGQVRTLA